MNDQPITNKPNGSGISRIFKASYCSAKGFKAAWQHESAFRQEAIIVLLLAPWAYFISTSAEHFYLLIGALVFVLFAELVNSALEALADKITLEHDPLIGRAKDIGSAAVFCALFFMVIVWAPAIFLKVTS